jgi:hypothetical protein
MSFNVLLQVSTLGNSCPMAKACSDNAREASGTIKARSAMNQLKRGEATLLA